MNQNLPRFSRLLLLASVLLSVTAACARANANASASVMLGGMAATSSASGAQLVARSRSVRPAGNVRVRVDNGSGQELSFGLEYELARLSRGSWIRLPPKPVFGPRFVLQPGTVGIWQPIHIPRRARRGLYRIRKRVYLRD